MLVKFIGRKSKGVYSLTDGKEYGASGTVAINGKGYFLLTSDDNGELPSPVAYEMDMFDYLLADGERYIVCPQCGDDRCYSGEAYDECDKCKYLNVHGPVACPCCGSMSLSEEGGYEICPVCDWEDDLLQRNEPDYAGGANWLSLNRSRENYRKHGKIETDQDLKECREYYAKHVMLDGRWLYNEEFIPQTTIGKNPNEIRKWVCDNNTNNDLAIALAQAYNKAAYLKINLVGLTETALSAEQNTYDEWHALFSELSEKVFSLMEDGESKPKPSAALYDSLEPFMEKYGYVNGGGWWVVSEEHRLRCSS